MASDETEFQSNWGSHTLVITKEQIIQIRNMKNYSHGNTSISNRQRVALLDLLRLQNSSHQKLQILGMSNGFDHSESTTYIVNPNICYQNLQVRPGDIMTYRNSFDGLEGMILGCTENHSKVAILNLNYEDSRYIIEHYDQQFVFGGFPNPHDIRELSHELVDWIYEIESETEEFFAEDVPHPGDMVEVTKSAILKIRNMTKENGHVAITDEQRKALWKLFRMHDYNHSYLRLKGLQDGFAQNHGVSEEPYYITIPKTVQSFGNHGLTPGDIITYSVSYTGLEGMILGVTNDRRKIAILNVNYSQERYLLEHYSVQYTFGGYPSAGDVRKLTSKFIDRGMDNREVAKYYDDVLLPFLRDIFGEYSEIFPDPLIVTIAQFVAEMTSIEDFGLLIKKRKSRRRCVIS